MKIFPLVGFLKEQIVLSGNSIANGRLLKLLQFQNKNFKSKWHIGSGQVNLTESPKTPETLGSNIRPKLKKLFSAKNIINISNLKKETPVRKFRIQRDCQFPVISVFSKLLFLGPELSKLLFHGSVGRKHFLYFCILKVSNFSIEGR